ncbi:MAG: hypothetical protein R8K22_03655, partial [Mariprofundaceae bacterium]
MNKLANISAMMVVMISGIALVGWWTDHATLAAWLPGISNMTFNTALCFMLVGVACCVPSDRMPACDSIRLGVGIGVAVFAVLSL